MNKDQNPKVLCLDDEIDVVTSLERSLRQQFVTEIFTDAHQALERIYQSNDIDIIICDYIMPGINGVEFFEKVKIHRPDIIRIILSGQIQIKDLERAINESIIHKFLLKPWDNEVLRLQMSEALQIRNLEKQNKTYYQLAITDPVTNLTNHRYFQEKLDLHINIARKKQHPLSLIMIDVDHFKSFNDRYGHPEGDRLLLHIASILKSRFENQNLVSRYGGEEFAITLPEVDHQEAFSIAEELRTTLEKTNFKGPMGNSLYLTISLGVATFPSHGSTPASLIQSADIALYQAKEHGRNTTIKAG